MAGGIFMNGACGGILEKEKGQVDLGVYIKICLTNAKSDATF